MRYARSGDLSIAYQVTGAGPLDLVLVPGFISHLEHDWQNPQHAAFLDRLGSFARLIRFDKRGTGLSDRQGGVHDLEARMDDVRAVMDDVGSERAALFGYFEGGPMSMLFAATHPERTQALVLCSTAATRNRSESYPWGQSDEQRRTIRERVADRWGEGANVLHFAPEADEATIRWWGERDRIGGSPGAIQLLMESTRITDVREILPSIQAPTLVLHRKNDPFLQVEEARYLSARIPGARLVLVPGHTTLPWLEGEFLLDETQEFLTGVRPSPVSERVLATILFTDLVSSTEKVRELGDAAWARLLEQHHIVVRRQLARFSGEEIDTAGDGFFAVFDGPARAIRCAAAVRDEVRKLGLDIRAGVHTGEVERPRGGTPRGIAVHTGARVAATASGGDIMVLSTTRDLVAGSGIEFEDRGEVELKGLDGPRHIYAVVLK